MRRVLGVIALCWIASVQVAAQAPNVDPDADALEALPIAVDTPDAVTLGDVATISIRVIADVGDSVAVPEQSLTPFEVLETQSATQDLGDGHIEFSFQLGLLALQVGTHEVGPIEIRRTTAAGELQALETPTVSIGVNSLIANEPNAEFKPPSKPHSIEQPDYTLAWVGGILLAMLIGGLLAWLGSRWWRRRDRPATPPPPAVPPWEIAARELRDLERTRERMIASGETDAWVDRVSDVVRKYLGDRFGFDGLESTTDEISHELHRAVLVGIDGDDATRFLAGCDLVKFAQAPLAEEASREVITDAFRLVERSRPVTPQGTPP